MEAKCSASHSSLRVTNHAETHGGGDLRRLIQALFNLRVWNSFKMLARISFIVPWHSRRLLGALRWGHREQLAAGFHWRFVVEVHLTRGRGSSGFWHAFNGTGVVLWVGVSTSHTHESSSWRCWFLYSSTCVWFQTRKCFFQEWGSRELNASVLTPDPWSFFFSLTPAECFDT